MTSLTIIGYLAVALVVLTVLPGLYVLPREARWRYVERRALARCEAARALLREHEQRPRDASATAAELTARFDPITIQHALDGLLLEQRHDVELFERLGLIRRYLHEVQDGATFCQRAHAADVLGRLGVPEACGPLLAALRDADEDLTVKRAAAEALAQIRDPRAVPHLVHELRALGAAAPPHLADALVGFGATAVPTLAELLSDDAVDARLWAAKILGRIGDPSIALQLAARLRDAQEKVREAAAEALGLLGDRRAVAALVGAALEDPASRVRASAATALARIDDERATEALVAMLSDDDAVARARALQALEALPPENIAPLYRALTDPRPAVRRLAAVAIERIGVLEAWMAELATDDPDRRGRARADVALLARAGLVGSLFSYLEHPDARIRAGVAEIWGEFGPERFRAEIYAAAGDPDPGVRASVAVALGRARPEDGAGVLAKLLADPEPDVRSRAAIALGMIGGSAAESALLGAAQIEPTAMVVACVLLATDASLSRATEDLAAAPALRLEVVLLLEREGEAAWTTFVERIKRWGRERSEEPEDPSAAARHVTLLRTSPDEIVRLRAVEALDRAGADDFADALADALAGDPSADVRLSAAHALAARPSSTAAKAALSRAALDPSPDVAVVAAQAVGSLRDPAYAEPLFARLASGSLALRSAVEEALAESYRARPAALVARMEAEHDPEVLSAYARVLERLGAVRRSPASARAHRRGAPPPWQSVAARA